MTATATRGGPAAGNAAAPGAPARRPARRRRPGFPRALACLAWGALAALKAGQRASEQSAAGCAWGLSRRLAEYR